MSEHRVYWPFIRGTNKKYGTKENGGFWGENGYNCIEVGYLAIDEHNQPIDITVLSETSDVIHVPSLPLSYVKVIIDCIGDGYLRISSFNQQRGVRWESELLPLSSMSIVYGKPFEELRP